MLLRHVPPTARSYHHKPPHNIVESLISIFEKLTISSHEPILKQTAQVHKIQCRTYTVQYRKYVRFKPKEKMDWEHLDGSGKIKASILEKRKQFLQERGLLKDCFTYKNRLVFANKHLYDLSQKDTLGRTNLERMEQGFCPVDKTGQDIIIIHHFDQTMLGPWVILTNLFHQNESRQLHSFLILKDKVIRDKFNNERNQYWKYQANYAIPTSPSLRGTPKW